MKIQPITTFNIQYRVHSAKHKEMAASEPNFKGVKGFIKGTTVGTCISAAGIALSEGLVALQEFAPYIAFLGIAAGFCTHMISKDKENNK